MPTLPTQCCSQCRNYPDSNRHFGRTTSARSPCALRRARCRYLTWHNTPSAGRCARAPDVSCSLIGQLACRPGWRHRRLTRAASTFGNRRRRPLTGQRCVRWRLPEPQRPSRRTETHQLTRSPPAAPRWRWDTLPDWRSVPRSVPRRAVDGPVYRPIDRRWGHGAASVVRPMRRGRRKGRGRAGGGWARSVWAGCTRGPRDHGAWVALWNENRSIDVGLISGL